MLKIDNLKPADNLKWYFSAIAIGWTLIILISLNWELYEVKQEALETARIQAGVAYEKDTVYRRWAAMHGGVYVPVTEKTPPNPYLDVPERDITTPSGRRLTLMNPAYMTRQVQETIQKQYGVRGALVSLKPIRPENKPDPWETKALKAIEQGQPEVSSVGQIEGREYMRLLRPLVTEKSCLRCHASQGHKEGDIRGGISVAVPMQPIQNIKNRNIRTFTLLHFIMWLVGMTGHFLWGKRLLKSESDTVRAKEEWERTFNAIPDFIAILGNEQNVVRCNRSMAEGLGYSQQEIRGMKCYTFFHKTDKPPDFCPCLSMAEDGKEHTEEMHSEILGKDFLVTTSPLYDDQQQTDGCVHIARDITDLKRTEKERNETRANFRRIFEVNPFPLAITKMEDAEFIFVNQASLDHFETDTEELSKFKSTELYANPDDRSEILKELQTTGQVRNRLTELRTFKGRSVWYLINCVLIDFENQPCLLIGLSDITERKKAEDALKKSEQHFRLVVENMNEGLGIGDREGKFIYVNPRLCQIIGREESEILGQRLTDFLDQENKDIFNKQQENRKLGKSGKYTMAIKRENKDTVHVLAAGHPVFDDQGEFAGSFGVVTDVTELKHIEENLKLFKTISDQANYGVGIVDLKGVIIYCNETFARMHGYESSELTGLNLSVFHNEDQMPEVISLNKKLLDEGSYSAEELWHTRSDGAVFPTLMNAVVIRNESGDPMYLSATALDITDLKKAEDELREKEEHIRLLLSSTAEAVFGLDLDGNCSFCNPACIRMTGYDSESDLLGKNMHNLIHHTRQDSTLFPEEECLIITSYRNGDEVHSDEEVFWRGDGTSFPAEYWSYPIWKNQEVIGSVVTFLDITERKRFEEMLLKAKESSEFANRTKSEFLANMSHEIRTPMNAIMGMSHVLLDTETTAEQKKHIEIIKASADNLLSIINDILDISKIEAGKIELETEDFNIWETVENIKDILYKTAHDRGIEFACNIDDDVPRFFMGDAVRVGQILLNLGSNAVKFTGKGEVAVRVSIDEDSEYFAVIRFTVSDTGIGISPDRLNDLFKSFSQVHTENKSRYGGTGLGLLISRRLAEMMGGEIGVVSEQGKGSAFWFTVVLEKGEQAGEVLGKYTDPGTLPDKCLHILLAEDNPFNREVVLNILKDHTIVVAENGRQALDALKKEKFDLILMDVQMPEMGGIEATAVIRDPASDVSDHDVPIIAMTAFAMKGDRERCLAAGMNSYVSKPVDPKKLKHAIDTLFTQPCLPEEDVTEVSDEFFDRDYFLENIAVNDMNVALNLIEIFLDKYQDHLSGIRDSIEKNDFDEVKRHAHGFKGMMVYFSQYGTDRLVKLENAGQNKDLSQAFEILAELEKKLGQLVPELSDFMAELNNRLSQSPDTDGR
ncbi:MAG: MEKHLA domain-containing protein [Desulfobacteraceae bacterium]|nr:MEKHLA domain-containing protein [Desulfobacteraceae bacterium]